jgi:hypothetical protein
MTTATLSEPNVLTPAPALSAKPETAYDVVDVPARPAPARPLAVVRATLLLGLRSVGAVAAGMPHPTTSR